MTFLYGTNMELLYSMPATGATQAASTQTLLTGNAANNPAFQLPALQNIWSPGNMIGKGLMFMASGAYSSATNSVATYLQFDGTANTNAAGSITLATSGLVAAPASSTGVWQAQCWLTCTGSGTASFWYGTGDIMIGVGSNETSACNTFMWGQPSILNGSPITITIPNTVPLFVELWQKWTTTVAVNVCSQFLVFGLN